MALFNDILTLYYSTGNKKKIFSNLSRWEEYSLNGKVIAKNIVNEKFLSKSAFKFLLDTILKDGDDPEVLEKAYGMAVRSIKRKGERIPKKLQPKVLGRAVNRSIFESWLFYNNHGKVFDYEWQVTAFIDRVIIGDPLSTSEADMLMNIFIAWVTWDEHGGNFPFYFLTSDNPNEVISNLGLDLKIKDEPLLLLTYHRKPDSLCVHKATVADAGLFYQFDPVLSHKHFGRTRPHPHDVFFKSGEYDPLHPPWTLKPRPEGVHKACPFEILISVNEVPA